jgi:hypothetical protein
MAQITFSRRLCDWVHSTGRACYASGDVCPVINLSATLLEQHETRMVAAVQEPADMLFEPVETTPEDAVPMEGEGLSRDGPATANRALHAAHSASHFVTGVVEVQEAPAGADQDSEMRGEYIVSVDGGGVCSMYAVVYLLSPTQQSPHQTVSCNAVGGVKLLEASGQGVFPQV